MSSRRYAAVLFAVAAITATSQAYAGHGYVPSKNGESGRWHFGPSTVTRAQVRAELESALRSGEFARDGGEAMYQMPRRGRLTTESTKTREQVMQEARAWRANPVTPAGYREVNSDQGWEYVGPQTPSTITREQVKQELRVWQDDPERQ